MHRKTGLQMAFLWDIMEYYPAFTSWVTSHSLVVSCWMAKITALKRQRETVIAINGFFCSCWEMLGTLIRRENYLHSVLWGLIGQRKGRHSPGFRDGTLAETVIHWCFRIFVKCGSYFELLSFLCSCEWVAYCTVISKGTVNFCKDPVCSYFSWKIWFCSFFLDLCTVSYTYSSVMASYF